MFALKAQVEKYIENNRLSQDINSKYLYTKYLYESIEEIYSKIHPYQFNINNSSDILELDEKTLIITRIIPINDAIIHDQKGEWLYHYLMNLDNIPENSFIQIYNIYKSKPTTLHYYLNMIFKKFTQTQQSKILDLLILHKMFSRNIVNVFDRITINDIIDKISKIDKNGEQLYLFFSSMNSSYRKEYVDKISDEIIKKDKLGYNLYHVLLTLLPEQVIEKLENQLIKIQCNPQLLIDYLKYNKFSFSDKTIIMPQTNINKITNYLLHNIKKPTHLYQLLDQERYLISEERIEQLIKLDESGSVLIQVLTNFYNLPPQLYNKIKKQIILRDKTGYNCFKLYKKTKDNKLIKEILKKDKLNKYLINTMKISKDLSPFINYNINRFDISLQIKFINEFYEWIDTSIQNKIIENILQSNKTQNIMNIYYIIRKYRIDYLSKFIDKVFELDKTEKYINSIASRLIEERRYNYTKEFFLSKITNKKIRQHILTLTPYDPE